MDAAILERTKTIVLARHALSARDVLHFAVMQAHHISEILSFDAGFDGLPGITRITT